MFKNITDYLNSLIKWFILGIPVDRLNGDSTGRKWVANQIGYTKDLTLANLRTVTDRSSINDQISQRLQVQNADQKQGIHTLKIQLSTLYSFQKCFVARHKTRLQYYRDDLSQKAYRNMLAVQQSYSAFTYLDQVVSTQNT
jgi:hypothetical protein